MSLTPQQIEAMLDRLEEDRGFGAKIRPPKGHVIQLQRAAHGLDALTVQELFVQWSQSARLSDWELDNPLLAFARALPRLSRGVARELQPDLPFDSGGDEEDSSLDRWRRREPPRVMRCDRCDHDTLHDIRPGWYHRRDEEEVTGQCFACGAITPVRDAARDSAPPEET